MFDDQPVPHPDDRDEPTDESGPWVLILLGTVVVWSCLALVEWRVLSEGTFLWATIRSLLTLVVAPLSAAALLQDTRALGADGVEVGLLKWAYAGVALFFPPVGGLYLGHRRVLRRT